MSRDINHVTGLLLLYVVVVATINDYYEMLITSLVDRVYMVKGHYVCTVFILVDNFLVKVVSSYIYIL